MEYLKHLLYHLPEGIWLFFYFELQTYWKAGLQKSIRLLNKIRRKGKSNLESSRCNDIHQSPLKYSFKLKLIHYRLSEYTGGNNIPEPLP